MISRDDSSASPDSPSPPAPPTSRVTYLLLTAVMGVAVVGYFVGTVGTGWRSKALMEVVATPPAPPAPPSDVAPAVSYAELRSARPGPNRDWSSRLGALASAAPAAATPGPPDPAVKAATLRQREERRAYNGAPPVVPHEIDQLTSAACLACHRDSVRVGDRVAARLPHPYLSSCTQCHVEQQSPLLTAEDEVTNAFAGLPAPFEGPRAWPGAPPIIPHSTLMRTDCLSCHGPAGPAGMQTTHPERAACLQCHAPSAQLDQYARGESAAFLPGPPVIPE